MALGSKKMPKGYHDAPGHKGVKYVNENTGEIVSRRQMLNDIRGSNVEQYQKEYNSQTLINIRDIMAADMDISADDVYKTPEWQEIINTMRYGDGKQKHDMIRWLYDNDYIEGDDRDDFYEDFT